MSQAGEVDITGTHPDIPTEFIADIGTAIPIANQLEILGATELAGTTPVFTEASGNTLEVKVQLSQAIAASDATKVGLCSFDSNDFAVDAAGFVTFTGGGGASTLIGVNSATAPGTNPVTPDGGDTITFDTAQVAAGALGTALQFNSVAANTATLQFQTSLNSLASDPTVNGVCHFSADFNVDGDGFVTFPYGSPISSISVEAATAPGTNPVLPNTGTIQFVGTLVAAGAGQALKTTSVSASQVDLEIQTSSAQVGSSSIANGVCHFSDVDFTVDSNGFVEIAALPSSFTWSVITADQLAVVNEGYICDKAGLLNLQLPVTSAVGDLIRVTGINTAVGWRVEQGASQQIHIGISSTTIGATGYIESTNIRDSVEMVCVVADTEWNVISSIGNITVA